MFASGFLHFALNEGTGPQARLVPVEAFHRWAEAPDFFSPHANWHHEWRGHTPGAVSPGGQGMVAVDVPHSWVGHAVHGPSPFRWTWGEPHSASTEAAQVRAFEEGRLLAKFHANSVDQARAPLLHVAPLSPSAGSLDEAIGEEQAKFLAGLPLPLDAWSVKTRLRQLPSADWTCVSFFGGKHATENWPGLVGALVQMEWGFSVSERIAWGRVLSRLNGIPQADVDALFETPRPKGPRPPG